MKKYLKGLISGFILAAVIFCIPAVAENVSVAFNEFRINVNGFDKAQWGESYTLDNGSEAPYSITYMDTAYLPIRKISELTGLYITYNGDSNTVSVLNGKPNNKQILAEKPDENGNVWTYSTFKINDSKSVYLCVEDKARGYQRIYRTMSYDQNRSVKVTDDAIYFVRYGEQVGPRNRHGDLRKIDFLNNSNTQDGGALFYIEALPGVKLDGDYIYYTWHKYVTQVTQTDWICVRNIFSGETSEPYEISRLCNDITYKGDGIYEYEYYNEVSGKTEKRRIVFDKNLNKFSALVKIDE